ncbi:MAG TPA: LptF/LptG family permease [Tepidisphaeraceae bacterium]|nr:LptF/LptG family permease [Tepidisphaeraceae bacterium]
MSRTLFKYIFWDLVKIFFLASGVLSAIMSFGGLLRPLYEYGLDVSQVGKILGWSNPAMTAYSLPIAALFATTIVYGRLAADNEVTACRAAGISFLSMALPAFVMGLLCAFVSLVLLCFFVPYSMLQVEKIVYSNIAQLVANQIERSHEIHFDQGDKPVTVHAQSARVLPNDPAHPNDQAVRLVGPTIVTYEAPDKNKIQVPEEFYMARSADVFIHQNVSDEDVNMWAKLIGGTKFPRTYSGASRQNMQISVGTQRVGPIPLPSPVKENTKFMNIFSLQAMLDAPEKSLRIRTILKEFITRDQEQQYLQQLADELNGPDKTAVLEAGAETYQLKLGGAPAEIHKDRLVLTGDLNTSPARLQQIRGNQSPIDIAAEEIHVKAYPDAETKRIQLEIDVINCVVTVGEDKSPRENFSRPITVQMPAAIDALTDKPAREYVSGSLSPEDQQQLKRSLIKLANSVISELHARMSFAVSCLILVMVGCALGMMFRSGNFLSAFAVSVVPALATIALIVAGQQTAQNVPWSIDASFHDPRLLGIVLIWSGNAANLVSAVVLLGRLHRN